MSDNVNHPAHYTDGKYETIEFIERNLFDYHDGNAIKYISRAGKKDPDKLIEDLEKALWYINRACHKLDYDEHAITVHDYILDKKLSPALASVVSLIETSCYLEAYEMLKAEIERLKKEREQVKINADKITLEHNNYCYDPGTHLYFGMVVCIKSTDESKFTVGKVYMAYGDRIIANNRVPIIFETPFYSVKDLNIKYWSTYGTIYDNRPVMFAEYKGGEY